MGAPRPSIPTKFAGLLLTYVSSSLKGLYYLYFVSVSLFLLVGLLAVVLSTVGINPLNQLLQAFKPVLIALGVQGNATISYSGPIPGELLAFASVFFSLLGYIGTKILEWWQKGKIGTLQEAKLLIMLALAANVSSSIVVSGLAYAKEGLGTAASGFIFTLISMSIISVFALLFYAIAKVVDAISGVILEGKIRIGWHQPPQL